MFLAAAAWQRSVIRRLAPQQPQLVLRSLRPSSSSHTPPHATSATAMKAFPTASLLPKEETLAAAFLEQYPTYDGRNTVVAIFDTGVDPGAIGLQTTPDGRPKVIDIIDATGAGDVDTSTVVTAQDDGKTLALASGKTLTLNPEWTPSVDGTYHVGTVAAYHLFPGQLVARLKKERRETFDIAQRDAVNAAQTALADWTKRFGGSAAGGASADAAQLRVKKDLLTRLSQLDELAKSYEDPGPIYDVVVFYDGSHWRAAVDAAESGDFTGVAALASYKLERQYATFSDASQLNYALNIYDNGNTLSIVNDVGAHGTHVAGIVAAYHEDAPACNGVAPGAQIIAVKIGDGRLGSMETTTALSRAILAVIDAKADIVNMSYGEYASQHNYGRIVELANELVDQHNVTFITSAGNNGPALGTVGAPGGTTSSMIGVGAYVSPAMMDAEYVMRSNELGGTAYTWSSRGPTFDGDMGVDICAPGAAIAPVPNWTLNKKQLMNGTSMSSPNAAGNVALLISALKDRGIAYTPYALKRALELTAVRVPGVEVFAQGRGLIQVLPAFEYLAANGNAFDGTRATPLTYTIKTSSGLDGTSARGVFLRDAVDFTHDATEVTVTVTPAFHKLAAPADKVRFELHAVLKPSARWIHVGRHAAIMHEGRGFKVLLETKHLAPGVHVGEIVAFDANNEARGAVFTIPVTVIKPEAVAPGATVTYDRALTPGDIARRFFTPPTGATWADITLTRTSGTTAIDSDDSNAAGKLYMVHVLQFAPFERQSSTSFQKAFFLRPGESVQYSVDVTGGLTAEVCLAQFWSALGDSTVRVEVRFHGVVPDQQQVCVAGGAGQHKVLLQSTVEPETLAPAAALTKWTQRLRPTSAVIAPLSSSRDQFPDKRQVYELVLTYSFSSKEAGKVVPRLPLLANRLYESPFEAQLSLVFDDRKQYVGCSDAYGDAVAVRKDTTYTVRSQVRHEDVAKLEALKHMVLFLERDVKDLAMPVFAHQDDAALGRSALSGAKALPLHTLVPVFVGEPSGDKLPAGVAPGDVLSGTIYYGKKNGGVTGAGRRPAGFPVSYVVPPPAPAAPKDPEPEAPKDERDEAELAADAVRDLLLARVVKLSGKDTFEAAWQRLADQYPTHLPVLQAKLHHVDTESTRRSALADVVAAADDVLARIDQDDLARFFGTRAAPSDATAAQKKRQTDQQATREILIDALRRRARALGDAGDDTDAFLAAFGALQQWVDTDAPASLHVALLHDRHHGALGLALQRLRKVADLERTEREKIVSADALETELVATLDALAWPHWKAAEQQWHRRRTPASYRKF